MTSADCAAGESCEGGQCVRTHGTCRTADDCPPATACRADLVVATAADSDGDEIPDQFDNCPAADNVLQTDTDGDSAGDACDPCGDGVVQAGEACDDGNTTGGDGCETDCSASAVGVGCTTIQTARLTLSKLGGTASDEGMSFSGKIQFGAGQPAGFTPLDALDRGAQILIEDVGNANAVVYELSHRTTPVPPGAKAALCSPTKKDGWKANAKSTTYTYTNATNAFPTEGCVAGSARGLKTFKLSDKRASARPSVAVSVKAAKASMATPVGPLRATVVLSGDAAAGLAGACGQVTFAACAPNATGTALICR